MVKAIIVLLIFQFIFNINLSAQEVSTTPSKSAATASTIALAGSVIPIMTGIAVKEPAGIFLILGGLILGPTSGYVYMDEPGLGLRYAGMRSLIMGGSISSVFLICSLGDCNWGLFNDDTGSEFDVAVMIMVFGTVTTMIHNLVDVFSVKRRVDSHMKRLAISPTYFPENKTPGLKAVWKF
jgi:hypothetical protein